MTFRRSLEPALCPGEPGARPTEARADDHAVPPRSGGFLLGPSSSGAPTSASSLIRVDTESEPVAETAPVAMSRVPSRLAGIRVALTPAAKGRLARTGARLARVALVFIALGVSMGVVSCGPRLVDPLPLVSPYDGPRLFAVAVPLNESGTSLVNTVRVAERFTEELEQVHGLSTVPTSRVIAAMRALGIDAVTSPEQAKLLMRTLRADGLIVSSVTAWDPYPPPVIGMSAELILADVSVETPMDPRHVTMSVGASTEMPPRVRTERATAQASGVFDGSNHATLKALAMYANGRAEPESAYGEDIYLVSIDSFMKFVGYEIVSELMSSERARIATEMAIAQAQAQAQAQAAKAHARSRSTVAGRASPGGQLPTGSTPVTGAPPASTVRVPLDPVPGDTP